MRRRESSSWSGHRHGLLQGSASAPRSPVRIGQFCGDIMLEGEELTHFPAIRPDAPPLLLHRQQQLLTLVREFVVHQMRVLEYCESVERTSLGGLETACLRLQEQCHISVLLQGRVRDTWRLRPLSLPVHRALGDLYRTLQHMTVKAATATQELVLRAVRRAARFPAELPWSLCRALTAYNSVVADVSPGAAPWTDLQPMSVTRFLEVMAEERWSLLAAHLSQVGLRRRLEEAMSREEEDAGAALSSRLETLIQDDHRQVAPLLKTLQHMVQSSVEERSLDSAEPPLYEQYCSRLWPLLCAHLFQALYPGQRGVRAMPALTPGAAGERTATIAQILLRVLTSDAVPERSRAPGPSFCRRLLHTAALISWDRGMCRALSLALTDKCVAPLLDDGAPSSHSRTAAALVTVCQELTVLLPALTSGDVSSHQGVISRCVTTLQLCDLWLRSRSQMYTSSGSLSHLLLISHGDLPVIKEQVRSVISAAQAVEGLPGSRRLRVKLQDVAESLEGVALSLPRLLGSTCVHQAQNIFQHMMPGGRHWRGKGSSGPDLVPSEYARAAVNGVLVPLLTGVRSLALEEQVSAISGTVGVFMEAWMEHILQERLRFRCEIRRRKTTLL